MRKAILLAFLLLTVLAQDETLTSSVTSAINTDTSGITDAPSDPAPATSSFLRSDTKAYGLAIAPDPTSLKPADNAFQYLNWVTNTSSYSSRWVATFTINFQTFCPNSVTLLISATSFFRVTLNGRLIRGWTAGFPNFYRIPLPPACQCNTILIEVFNFFGGKSGIIYSLSQNTNNCYNCPPTSTRFFNYAACQCQCKIKCCPPGQSLDKIRCTCYYSAVANPYTSLY